MIKEIEMNHPRLLMNEANCGGSKIKHMIKAVGFDADGMVVQGQRFSDRLAKDFGIPQESIQAFFTNEFQLCLIGKADLKIALAPYIDQWGWQGSVDSLLDYWFSDESQVNQEIVNAIAKLRHKGIKCYLLTNQEKYRTEYFANQLDFATIFDEMFSSAAIGYKKPQPEFFEAISKQIAPIRKNEVLFWDDELKNVNAAKQFGFQAKHYANLANFKKVVALSA